MKQLEDNLKPLLDRMRRSPGWFFSVLLITISVPGFVGAGLGSAFTLQSDIPEIVGLVLGIALYLGLFVLMFHSTKRHQDQDAASLKSVFAKLDQTTLGLIETALDVQLTYIEAVIEVLKAEVPEKAAELDAALRELKRQRADLLANPRRPPTEAELSGRDQGWAATIPPGSCPTQLRMWRTIALMRLYLSSYGIPNLPELEKLVGKELPAMQIGYILNAMDDKTPADYQAKYDEWHGYWGERGAVLTDVDLLKLQGEDLASYLGSFDLLWAKGGNTYYLRYAMKASGFDRAIRQALEAGVVYGGDSAGAIIAGPSIKHIEDGDDPTGVPELIYGGLDLTPYVLMPHWENPEFGPVAVAGKQALERDGYTVRVITDSQARVIDGADDRLVSAP